MIADRNAVDLALSDLIISRVRSRFRFDFIGAENTPPGLLNSACLSSVGCQMTLSFYNSPSKQESYGCYNAASLQVCADPIDQSNWQAFTTIVDSAVGDFPGLATATTHSSRLIFLFNYELQTHVTSDLRYEFFARLFQRFNGTLTYVEPETYGIPIEINDWNIHPTGMPLAWEGEYVFQDRIPLVDIATSVQEFFNVSLRQGWPTRLPVREIQGVPCRFTLMPRYF